MEEQQVRELKFGDSAIQVNFRNMNFENKNWNEQGMQIVKI
jgi:phage-related protein